MKILITAELTEQVVKELSTLGTVTKDGWQTELRVFNEDEMQKIVAGYDIIITSYDEITKKVIDSADKTKNIICTRASPANVDIAYANAKGIKVSFTPGRNSDSAAEYTIALMMSIGRKIAQSYTALKRGEYTKKSQSEKKLKEGLKEDVTWALSANTPYVIFKGNQLCGNTLGIIGYGDIGRRVSKIANAMGMKVLAYDKYSKEADGIAEFVDFDYLLKHSDFISVHAKPSPENKHFINADAFKLMKKTAYIVNTARGSLIDEKALIEALKNKEIAGAALDVFESEPISEKHPFITELDNVLITPHLGGATYEAIQNHSKMVLEEVKNILDNRKLSYEYKL